MATWTYWNQSVSDASGNVLAGRAGKVYTAQTGGTQITSTLRTYAGGAASGNLISSDADGWVKFAETSGTFPLLWWEAPDLKRYPCWALEAIGASIGAGNVSDNTTETITAAWTFTTNPVFNDGAIPQAKIVNLTADLAAAANPTFKGTVANSAAMVALTGTWGIWCFRSDTASVWMLLLGSDPSVAGNWVNLSGGSSTFTPSLANTYAGDVAFQYGLSTAARITSRTDLLLLWLTSDGLTPINMMSHDVHLNALES